MANMSIKGIKAPKGGFVQRIDPATGKPISQIGALGQKIKGMPGQAVDALGKKFPRIGDHIQHEHFSFNVEAVDRKGIKKVRVKINETQ